MSIEKKFQNNKQGGGIEQPRQELKEINEKNFWEKTKEFLFNKEILKQIGKTTIGSAASIVGIKSFYDVPAYVSQKFGVRKDKKEYKEILGDLSKNDISEEEMQNKKVGEVIKLENIEAMEDKIDKMGASEEIKDKLMQELNSLVENYHEERETLEAGQNEKLTDTLDEYIKTKISGVQATREALNTFFVASGAYGLRGVSYGLMDGVDRYLRLGKEAEKKGEKVSIIKDIIVGGIKETWQEARFKDAEGMEKTKKQKGLSAVRAWGKIARYAGIGAMVKWHPETAGNSIDKALDALEGKVNLGDVVENYKGNISRLTKFYGGIVKKPFSWLAGDEEEAGQVVKPEVFRKIFRQPPVKEKGVEMPIDAEKPQLAEQVKDPNSEVKTEVTETVPEKFITDKHGYKWERVLYGGASDKSGIYRTEKDGIEIVAETQNGKNFIITGSEYSLRGTPLAVGTKFSFEEPASRIAGTELKGEVEASKITTEEIQESKNFVSNLEKGDIEEPAKGVPKEVIEKLKETVIEQEASRKIAAKVVQQEAMTKGIKIEGKIDTFSEAIYEAAKQADSKTQENFIHKVLGEDIKVDNQNTDELVSKSVRKLSVANIKMNDDLDVKNLVHEGNVVRLNSNGSWEVLQGGEGIKEAEAVSELQLRGNWADIEGAKHGFKPEEVSFAGDNEHLDVRSFNTKVGGVEVTINNEGEFRGSVEGKEFLGNISNLDEGKTAQGVIEEAVNQAKAEQAVIESIHIDYGITEKEADAVLAQAKQAGIIDDEPLTTQENMDIKIAMEHNLFGNKQSGLIKSIIEDIKSINNSALLLSQKDAAIDMEVSPTEEINKLSFSEPLVKKLFGENNFADLTNNKSYNVSKVTNLKGGPEILIVNTENPSNSLSIKIKPLEGEIITKVNLPDLQEQTVKVAFAQGGLDEISGLTDANSGEYSRADEQINDIVQHYNDDAKHWWQKRLFVEGGVRKYLEKIQDMTVKDFYKGVENRKIEKGIRDLLIEMDGSGSGANQKFNPELKPLEGETMISWMNRYLNWKDKNIEINIE